jgi:hypothetical protein
LIPMVPLIVPVWMAGAEIICKARAVILFAQR